MVSSPPPSLNGCLLALVLVYVYDSCVFLAPPSLPALISGTVDKCRRFSLFSSAVKSSRVPEERLSRCVQNEGDPSAPTAWLTSADDLALHLRTSPHGFQKTLALAIFSEVPPFKYLDLFSYPPEFF